jgi:hypothetical protein
VSRRSVPAITVLALALIIGAAFARTARPADAAIPAPITNYMYGTNMIPPINTQAYGFVRFFFNNDRTEADVTVDVKGLSNTLVTGADLHIGTAGTAGPVVKHLADGGFIVTGTHVRFSQQDLQAMAAGQWYAQVNSQFHPDGEMRGQVVLPSDFFPSYAPPAQLPQQVIQLPPQPLVVQSVSPAPPPPLETLPPGVIPADPGTDPYAASVNFQLFEECLPGASVRMRISWNPYGVGPQYADLSLSNDNFAPGSFVGNGPMPFGQRMLTWDGLQPATWHYMRINTAAPDGWVPSQTIAFYTRNDCR